MSDEIRPLRLVRFQPSAAVERSRSLSLRFPAVNLAGSPLCDIGGLGLVCLGLLVTLVMPGAWWFLLASLAAGAGLGAVLIAARRRAAERRRLEPPADSGV